MNLYEIIDFDGLRQLKNLLKTYVSETKID